MKISEILRKAADSLGCSDDEQLLTPEEQFSCSAIWEQTGYTNSRATKYYSTFAPNGVWRVFHFQFNEDLVLTRPIEHAMCLRFDMLNLAAEVAESEGL